MRSNWWWLVSFCACSLSSLTMAWRTWRKISFLNKRIIKKISFGSNKLVGVNAIHLLPNYTKARNLSHPFRSIRSRRSQTFPARPRSIGTAIREADCLRPGPAGRYCWAKWYVRPDRKPQLQRQNRKSETRWQLAPSFLNHRAQLSMTQFRLQLSESDITIFNHLEAVNV